MIAGLEVLALLIAVALQFWPQLLGLCFIALAYWLGRYKVSINITRRK
jgi:hypothetical protein